MAVLFFSALFKTVSSPQTASSPQTFSEVMATRGILFAKFIYNLQCSFLAVTDKNISGSAHRCKETVFSLCSW